MMLNAFSSIKIKINFKPTVDNLIFRMHYRYTYILFISCVILTTLYDWVGNKIECMISMNSESVRDMVNSWCFIMGTFTVDKHTDAEVGKEVPFPGVGPHQEDDQITVHSYYQWVPFVLFFQGVCFYIPHWIWKGWEGGLFHNVIMDLSIRDYLANDLGNYERRREKYDKLAKYIKNHLNTHRMWAYKFFFCEAMNLLVSIFVFCFTNWFLGGQFTSYGTDVIKYVNMDPENRTDPMYLIFPRMAKCTFHMYGPSGTIEILDVMCLIATNVINEKIYICIWLWLVLLMTVTSAWLLFRITTIFIPAMRYFLLKQQATRSLPSEVRTVMEESNLSDWFLLHNLGKNMDRTVFSEFLSCLARELQVPDDDDVDPQRIPLTRELSS